MSIMTSSGEVSPSVTPSMSAQAPKYGTLIPNRIFVGGIAANTTEQELKIYFAAHGAVKDCKIIADRAGVSKGYGFVTFECVEDAEKIIKNEGDNLVFKERKLNIGPAIRKQAFSRETSMSPGGTVLYSNGVPYTFQNGMAVFSSPEGYALPAVQQQPAAYPVMMSPPGQPMYITQPGYSYQNAPMAGTPCPWTGGAAAAAQWRWGAGMSPQSPATPGMMPSSPQYIYPHHEMMMYSQPQYQATDLAESSMMEAVAPPSEGSITLVDSTPVRYTVDQYTANGPGGAAMSAADISQQMHHQMVHQSSNPIMNKSPHINVAPYPTAVKRPLPTPRKLLATPPSTPGSMTYSPQNTTPIKYFHQTPGQRYIAKAMMPSDRSELGNPHELMMASGLTPLTPPATPQGEINL